MNNKLRKCSCCLNQYEYCPKCQKDSNKETWHFTFCSKNCKDIYTVTSQFENGQIDAQTAKEQLEKLDLSKKDTFGTSYKNSIEKIMNSESVKNDVIIEDMTTEENVDDNIEKQVIEEENNKTTENVVEEKVLKKSRNKRTKNDVEE